MVGQFMKQSAMYNDYVTTLCEIKQVVREFSYKLSYVYMQLFAGPILKNNCWPFFDVQRFERSN